MSLGQILTQISREKNTLEVLNFILQEITGSSIIGQLKHKMYKYIILKVDSLHKEGHFCPFNPSLFVWLLQCSPGVSVSSFALVPGPQSFLQASMTAPH